MKSSPSSCTRRGSQSGAGSSSDKSAGSQNRLKAVPIGVPAPTRQISSLFSLDSMAPSQLIALRLPWKITKVNALPWKRIAIGTPRAYDLYPMASIDRHKTTRGDCVNRLQNFVAAIAMAAIAVQVQAAHAQDVAKIGIIGQF